MSDLDPGYTGGDLPDTGHESYDDGGHYGDLNAGHENIDFNQGHELFDNQADHFGDVGAHGSVHQSEVDQHFETGQHVESGNPDAHFDEGTFAGGDAHAGEFDQNFGEHLTGADHASNFGDIDQLQRSFEGDTLGAHNLDDGGSSELSAVSN